MRIYVYFVGKPRDAALNAFAAEFLKRTSRYTAVEQREIDPQRADPFDKHASARHLLLDPAGKLLDSHAFTRIVEDAETIGRDLVFTIGGHDGLPSAWRAKGELLSLSPITFPHELARAILAEQIYRALTTLRGHPYPR
jgi:23S rRNA (pseudouridine1915-N3)-methyltransferase